MSLVVIGGFAEVGKDAFLDGLVERHAYSRTFMSRPLRDALLTLNPIVNLTLLDNVYIFAQAREVRYQELHNVVGYEASKKEPEVRRLLQVLGTDVGRQLLGMDVWVNQVVEELAERHKQLDTYWGVTGMRFHNELEIFKAEGAISVWVDRPGKVAVNAHVSDNTLTRDDFDIVIYNDGSIEDLHSNAHIFHELYMLADNEKKDQPLPLDNPAAKK